MKNEPAFPTRATVVENDIVRIEDGGLTKLEYFAIDIASNMIGGILGRNDKFEFSYDEIAEASVGAAKALIKQLEQEVSNG